MNEPNLMGVRELVIIQGDALNADHLYRCSVGLCEIDLLNEPITHYYSYKHAKDNGWRFSSDKLFSEDGSYVGICPTCTKHYLWRN